MQKTKVEDAKAMRGEEQEGESVRLLLAVPPSN